MTTPKQPKEPFTVSNLGKTIDEVCGEPKGSFKAFATMPHRYELWKFFADNHGLILLESELSDIVTAVQKQLEKEKL